MVVRVSRTFTRVLPAIHAERVYFALPFTLHAVPLPDARYISQFLLLVCTRSQHSPAVANVPFAVAAGCGHLRSSTHLPADDLRPLPPRLPRLCHGLLHLTRDFRDTLTLRCIHNYLSCFIYPVVVGPPALPSRPAAVCLYPFPNTLPAPCRAHTLLPSVLATHIPPRGCFLPMVRGHALRADRQNHAYLQRGTVRISTPLLTLPSRRTAAACAAHFRSSNTIFLFDGGRILACTPKRTFQDPQPACPTGPRIADAFDVGPTFSDASTHRHISRG